MAGLLGFMRLESAGRGTRRPELAVQKQALRTWARSRRQRLVGFVHDDAPADEIEYRPALVEALVRVRDGSVAGLAVHRLACLADDLVRQEQLLAEIGRLGGTAHGRCGIRREPRVLWDASSGAIQVCDSGADRRFHPFRPSGDTEALTRETSSSQSTPAGEAGMKVHRAIVAAVGIGALSGALAAPAGADPKGEIIELECDALGTVEVVVFSNGPWSPGLVVGTNQVGIPYKFHIEGTFTPIGGEPESFVEDSEKPAPRNGRLDHCTFHDEGSDEFGSFVVDGEVWISYTPAH